MTIYDYTLELPEEVSDNRAGQREMEAEADIYWILKRLPKRQRQCLKLFSEGYTYREISKKLGISINAVKNAILKARKKANKTGYSWYN